MTTSQIKGVVVFSFGFALIGMCYNAPMPNGEETWMVLASLFELLPFLLPLIFLMSGLQFARNSNDIESGLVGIGAVCLTVIIALASMGAAFLVSSVLRDALFSKMKYGDFSVYLSPATPFAFSTVIGIIAICALLARMAFTGRISRSINGGVVATVAGTLGIYLILQTAA